MTSFFQEGPDKYFHQSRLDCILVLVSRALSIYRKDDTSPKGKESQGTTSWKLGWLTVSAVANSGWYYKTFSISRVRVLIAWYRVTIGWEASSMYLLLYWTQTRNLGSYQSLIAKCVSNRWTLTNISTRVDLLAF